MSVTTATELWRLSATDLAQAIRSKQTSSQEVIEAHLRRIEAVNPAVNAVAGPQPAVGAGDHGDPTRLVGDVRSGPGHTRLYVDDARKRVSSLVGLSGSAWGRRRQFAGSGSR
jgi:hypothetical protein